MLVLEVKVIEGNKSISLLLDRVASTPRIVVQIVKLLPMLKGPSVVLVSV